MIVSACLLWRTTWTTQILSLLTWFSHLTSGLGSLLARLRQYASASRTYPAWRRWSDWDSCASMFLNRYANASAWSVSPAGFALTLLMRRWAVPDSRNISMAKRLISTWAAPKWDVRCMTSYALTCPSTSCSSRCADNRRWYTACISPIRATAGKTGGWLGWSIIL